MPAFGGGALFLLIWLCRTRPCPPCCTRGPLSLLQAAVGGLLASLGDVPRMLLDSALLPRNLLSCPWQQMKVGVNFSEGCWPMRMKPPKSSCPAQQAPVREGEKPTAREDRASRADPPAPQPLLGLARRELSYAAAGQALRRASFRVPTMLLKCLFSS